MVAGPFDDHLDRSPEISSMVRGGDKDCASTSAIGSGKKGFTATTGAIAGPTTAIATRHSVRSVRFVPMDDSKEILLRDTSRDEGISDSVDGAKHADVVPRVGPIESGVSSNFGNAARDDNRDGQDKQPRRQKGYTPEYRKV